MSENQTNDTPVADEAVDESKPQISDCSEYIQEVKRLEDRYKRALADYRNLERRSAQDIQDGINQATDKIMRGFLDIYDDFVRARNAYAATDIKTEGLDAVVKNADVLLKKIGVVAVEPLGDIFDPHNQEAIQSKVDPDLDEQTVTAVLRKGYIVNDRVLRPALVEISTKNGDKK